MRRTALHAHGVMLAVIAVALAITGPVAASQPGTPVLPPPELNAPQSTILLAFFILAGITVAVFAGVALSTRRPSDVDVKKAYTTRRVFFVAAAFVFGSLLGATLPRAPYAMGESEPDRVVYVAAWQFSFVFSDEPIVSLSDLARVNMLAPLEVAQSSLVEFRVTALDVNHGFALYGPHRQLIGQTQAMPGYVNRLRVRLTDPGQYRVFCLEYCAAGHHLMRSSIAVK